MQRLLSSMKARRALAIALLAWSSVEARADAIVDWNVTAGEIVVASRMGTPPAIRVMAIVQTAADAAVNSITGHYRVPGLSHEPIRSASVDAAVAAAHHSTLSRLIPTQQERIASAYRAALERIPDGEAKQAGIALGERAAALVLAERLQDGAATAEIYRPHAAPGTYVPTATPAVSQWPQRKPWVMTHAAQFRPGPPPALTSELWARDYNEVKLLGGKASTARTAEQTEIARFWEFSLPSIYHGVVRSVALRPGRDVSRNARLFAAVAQAMDDALISVFDAKYHYNFWRPVTAIRNGDADGNDATERDAGWAAYIDNPLHPEYPSAHTILAAAVGSVLQAEFDAAMPALETASPSADGRVRRWNSVEDFVREVAAARVYEGVHFRNSTEIGAQMGRQIGALAARKLLMQQPGQLVVDGLSAPAAR